MRQKVQSGKLKVGGASRRYHGTRLSAGRQGSRFKIWNQYTHNLKIGCHTLLNSEIRNLKSKIEKDGCAPAVETFLETSSHHTG